MKVRNLLSVLMVLLLILGLTACGGSSEAMDSNGIYYDAEMESPAEAPEAGLSKSENTTAAALPTDRKLIRTISMEAETEDLTTLTDALVQRISALGGYVEAKEQYNGSRYGGYIRRNLHMVVRIPADQADAFVEQVSQQANVVSSSENVDDVTLQYVDTESKVKALETEQDRLLALLEQAETLEEILKIEDRLTQVRYELERYASQLRTLDNQVTYATIRLNITEVKEYTPVVEEEPTAWQRITKGFRRSLENIGEDVTEFFIWLAVNSPYLLIWGILGTVAVLLLRRRGWKRIRREKKETPPEQSE